MKFFRLWVPVFIWCGLIFYLSSIPQLGTGWGAWDFFLRKFAHMAEYFILAMLLYRALKGTFKVSPFYLNLLSFSLSFLYAVSDEVHQSFVPARGSSPTDVFIDTLGIIAFYLILRSPGIEKLRRITGKLIPLTLILLSGFVAELKADMVYLKNGNSIECFIKNEDENSVELDVGFGTVKFNKSQIERIDKSTPEEARVLQEKWRKQQLEREKQKAEDLVKPKNNIEIPQDKGHITLSAVVNKKVTASFVMDTGASLVLLSNDLAKKLKIDTTDKKELIQLQLADGRKIDAQHVILESVSVQGVEVKNIEAAFLLEKVENPDFKDGLLGMSYLDRFNFKTDKKRKKIILEKLP